MINFSKPTGPLLGLLYFSVFYVIAVVIFTLLMLLSGIAFRLHTGGYSKTVGWAYDICSLVHFTTLVSVGIFILIYLLIMLLKMRMFRIISILHFLITITGTLYLFFEKEHDNCNYFVFINVFSILFSGIYFTVLSILKLVDVIKNRR